MIIVMLQDFCAQLFGDRFELNQQQVVDAVLGIFNHHVYFACNATHPCDKVPCVFFAASLIRYFAIQVIARASLDLLQPALCVLEDGGGPTGTHEAVLFCKHDLEESACCCIVDLWSSLSQPFVFCVRVMRGTGSDVGHVTHILDLHPEPPLHWCALTPPLLLPIKSPQHDSTMYQVITLAHAACVFNALHCYSWIAPAEVCLFQLRYVPLPQFEAPFPCVVSAYGGPRVQFVRNCWSHTIDMR
jgi:hypothetical protein